MNRRVRHKIISGLTWIILSAMMALVVALSVVPWAVHGAALTVLTGSMRPTIEPGDVTVVKGVEDASKITIGDVITFMPFPDDPTLVTHRVIGIGSTSEGGRVFTTQGDNNNTPDEPVMDYQVRGKVLYTVPKIGKYTRWGQGHSRWLPAAFGAGLLAYAAVLLIASTRPTKSPHQAPTRRPTAPLRHIATSLSPRR
jgi:signal peptidase